ncbi:unnamed protein product, partial [Didymodactylos carnosus]
MNKTHLNVTCQREAGGELVNDIAFNASQDLIGQSTGLCGIKDQSCILESVVPKGKRSTTNNFASKICNVFMTEALQQASSLNAKPSEEAKTIALTACISDVTVSNDLS